MDRHPARSYSRYPATSQLEEFLIWNRWGAIGRDCKILQPHRIQNSDYLKLPTREALSCVI
jgi:hypothetical protein